VLLDMPVSSDLDERLYPEVFARYRTVLAEFGQRCGLRVV
jgi:hypothetical protein